MTLLVEKIVGGVAGYLHCLFERELSRCVYDVSSG
jgi:hypothetical protein